jgi:inner membrane protein
VIARVLAELGPWSWMALGFALLALELALPGVFLLWIGLAALFTGFVSLQLWEVPLWTWHVQVLLFIVLCPLTVWAGRKIFGGAGGSDQPLLNRRGQQLVGRTATLAEPIREGRGRVRLGDTLWRVTGPDLPAGSRVRVTGVEDTQLTVVSDAG